MPFSRSLTYSLHTTFPCVTGNLKMNYAKILLYYPFTVGTVGTTPLPERTSLYHH